MHDKKSGRTPYPGLGAEFARKGMPMERMGNKDYMKEDALPKKAKKKKKKSALMEELARK